MIQVEALYNGYGKKLGEFNLSQFYFMQMSPQNFVSDTPIEQGGQGGF